MFKTKEQIDEIREKFYKWFRSTGYFPHAQGISDVAYIEGYIEGYTQAQQDMMKELQEKDEKITRLKKALEIAEETIGFYADATNNPKQYMRQGYLVYNLKKKIFVDGGEKAREAQKQIKEALEG